MKHLNQITNNTNYTELLSAARHAIQAFPSISLVEEPGFAFKLGSDKVFSFDCPISMVEAHADAIEALNEIIGSKALYKEVSRTKETKNGIYISEVTRKSGVATQIKVSSVFSDHPQKKSITVTFDSAKINPSFILAIAREIKANEEQGIEVSYDNAKLCFKYILKNYNRASMLEFLTQSNGWHGIEVLSVKGQYQMQPVTRAKGTRIMPDNTSFQSKHGRGNIIISKGGKRMSLSFNNTKIITIQALVLEWLKSNITDSLQITDNSKDTLRQNWKAFLSAAQIA